MLVLLPDLVLSASPGPGEPRLLDGGKRFINKLFSLDGLNIFFGDRTEFSFLVIFDLTGGWERVLLVRKT